MIARTCLLMVPLLAGCSLRDPASEAPVDLKPGKYDIVASGKSYIEIEPSSQSGSRCFSDFEAREFARFPMRKATRLWRGCSDTDEPRKGNAVNGKRYCKGAEFRDDDESTYTYVAEIDTDGEGFVIKGETRDKEDGSGPDSGPWRVIGRRVGDC